MELKVVTFNLWGIFNSKDRRERMVKFASKVPHYDVILLQEQFSAADLELIERRLPPAAKGKFYFRRFPSSFVGSGCAVISRYPIRSALFHVYPMQGYPEMVLHGDFYANKGAALIKVDVPLDAAAAPGTTLRCQTVHLYTTHLVACYQRVSELLDWRRERYLPYRIGQAVSLANFIINTSDAASDHVVVAGDFNASQRSMEVQTLLIMLKRAGFNMRSVLPTPTYFIEEGADPSPQHREAQARSTYTYSTKNAYNASKTSYFKLLGMEADMPAQIDHIFYSNNTFALRRFDDCPDVKEGYSVTVKDEAGVDRPCGLVVFTKNEVPVPFRPSLLARGAVWLHKRGERLDDKSTGRRAIQGVARWLCPGVAALADRSPSTPEFFPLSDHYGVAARLGSRDATSPSAAPLAPGAQELSEEEANVILGVAEYLEAYRARMQRQARLSRYAAAVSFATVALNVWLLRRWNAQAETRVAVATAEVYRLAPLIEKSRGKQGGGGGDSQNAIKRITLKALTLVKLRKDNGGSGATAAADSEAEAREAAGLEKPDFRLLARELCGRAVWNSAEGSAAVNIIAALFGTCSLAVGLLHRQSTVKVLDDLIALVCTV